MNLEVVTNILSKICGQFDLCSHEYSDAVRARIFLGEVYYFYETAAIRLLYVEVIAETQALPRAYPKITDPAELAIAKNKLLILAQFELFPVKLNLQSGITTEKRSNRIAGYSPFNGPGAFWIFVVFSENNSEATAL